MAITIHDVAKKAGVSHTTVSWVIHDDPRITQETKNRVWAAIKVLNYHPNFLARSLVSGKTETIAIMAPFFSSFFELEILRGIELSLAKTPTQYNIILYSTQGQPEKKDQLLRSVLFSKRADALILLSMKMSPELLQIAKDNAIPVVLVEEYMPGAHIVKTDNYKGGFKATEYLIGKGKSKIGLITGQYEGEEVGLSPKERLEGYRAALEKHGLPFDQEFVSKIIFFHVEEGTEAIKTLMNRKNPVDSVFCSAGDMVALGAMKGCRELGFNLPKDVGIIGYDDIAIASLSNPTLTTVKQPLLDMGKKAMEIALQASSTKNLPPIVAIFEPEIVERESV